MKLDYTLTDAQKRNQLVKDTLATRDHWSSAELRQMADYILAAVDNMEKREILTDNRLVTINRREVSFQSLADRLDGGEDALHGLIKNDKHMILSPHIEITDRDLEEIPELRALRDEILALEKKLGMIQGKPRYNIKKVIIEMRKQQYTLKSLNRPPLYAKNNNKSISAILQTEINLGMEEHVSSLLTNYSRLKQETDENLDWDLRWILIDLENLIEKYIRNDYPLYYQLIIMKIEGRTNADIQHELQMQFGRQHSQEYISSLWRNKIPHIISEGHREEWLNWVYLVKIKGQYKQCSRCGEIKLAHKRYFSINKSARYGFYSICKKCRNKDDEE